MICTELNFVLYRAEDDKRSLSVLQYSHKSICESKFPIIWTDTQGFSKAECTASCMNLWKGCINRKWTNKKAHNINIKNIHFGYVRLQQLNITFFQKEENPKACIQHPQQWNMFSPPEMATLNNTKGRKGSTETLC